MAVHHRHGQSEAVMQKAASPRGQNIFSKVADDIKALNSSILIISQKIRFLVRNEKILSRNLLVVNKKVKELQDTRQSGPSVDTSGLDSEIAEVNSRLSELTEKLVRLESDVSNIKQNYAKAEQVAEIKYVIDSINPLEFATLKDLQEFTGKSTGKKQSAKKEKERGK